VFFSSENQLQLPVGCGSPALRCKFFAPTSSALPKKLFAAIGFMWVNAVQKTHKGTQNQEDINYRFSVITVRQS